MAETAIAKIHFPDNIELAEAIAALAGIERIYSEIAICDSTMDELAAIARVRDDSDWYSHTTRIAAAQLVKIAATDKFDATYAIRRTDYAPRVITAHETGSWVVDLVGKLNPIESLKSVLELMRDWSAERDRKRLLNSKLAQEVVSTQIANDMANLDVLQKAAAMLKDGGVDESTVQLFVDQRVRQLIGGAVVATSASKSTEVMTLPEYQGTLNVEDTERAVMEYLAEIEKLPSVWSNSNRLLPPPNDD